MRNSSRHLKLELAVIGTIFLIGLLHLAQPIYDDQALFIIGAEAINKGAVLYRDFWDIKQPGIFLFYLMAGKLFGFNEVGAHAFELLYLTAFSIVLMKTMKKYYRQAWLASLAPLFTVGIYYGVAGISQLGQVEGLVSFPMFLCLWFAYTASQEAQFRGARFFVSGLMGGIALIFKLMFAPIVLAFWVTTLGSMMLGEGRRAIKSVAVNGAAVFAGVFIPLSVMFAYFARAGALDVVYYTFFVYPPRAIAILPHAGPGRLFDGLQWFFSHFAPVMALALVGAWTSLSKRANLLTTNLVLWVIVGSSVIGLQRLSWWRYQYLLLFLPLGLLAVKGIEALWPEPKDAGSDTVWTAHQLVLPILSLVLLFSPILNSFLMKSLVLASYRFHVINREERQRYQSDKFLYPDSLYPSTIQEVEFLSGPDSMPGEIYVAGSPMFYFLSGRHQAIALNGELDFFLPEQWRGLEEGLNQTKPAYIFVASMYRDLFEKNTPGTVRFLAANYCVFRTSSRGTWYVLAIHHSPSAKSL